MKNLFLVTLISIFMISFISCSTDNTGYEEEDSTTPTIVLHEFTHYLKTNDYRSAVSYLSAHSIDTIVFVTDVFIGELQADSNMKAYFENQPGFNLEELLEMNSIEKTARYLSLTKELKYLCKMKEIISEDTTGSNAFVTYINYLDVEDVIHMTSEEDIWKIDIIPIMLQREIKARVYENAHLIQLAAEEYMFVNDSIRYPLYFEEIELPAGYKNPYNGDSNIVFFSQTPPEEIDAALAGYIHYYCPSESSNYIISGYGKYGEVIITLIPMPME